MGTKVDLPETSRTPVPNLYQTIDNVYHSSDMMHQSLLHRSTFKKNVYKL